MSAQRHDRNKGRKAAVQVLYAAELTGQEPQTIAQLGAAPEELELDEYALCLVRGVAEHKTRIDALLKAASENWSVSRMPVVDKCILRVAVFEMEHVNAVPVAVSINEAVELAKDFGGEDESHRFVNGVLGRIASQLAAGAQVGKDGEAEAEEIAAEEPAVPSQSSQPLPDAAEEA